MPFEKIPFMPILHSHRKLPPLTLTGTASKILQKSFPFIKFF